MTEITLPSGAVLNFGDSSQEDIASSLTDLRAEKPELFMIPEVSSEPESIDYSTATEEEIEAYFAQKKES